MCESSANLELIQNKTGFICSELLNPLVRKAEGRQQCNREMGFSARPQKLDHPASNTESYSHESELASILGYSVEDLFSGFELKSLV